MHQEEEEDYCSRRSPCEIGRRTSHIEAVPCVRHFTGLRETCTHFTSLTRQTPIIQHQQARRTMHTHDTSVVPPNYTIAIVPHALHFTFANFKLHALSTRSNKAHLRTSTSHHHHHHHHYCKDRHPSHSRQGKVSRAIQWCCLLCADFALRVLPSHLLLSVCLW